MPNNIEIGVKKKIVFLLLSLIYFVNNILKSLAFKVINYFLAVIHEYLNKEENSIPRAGAVALGGMAGIIFGIRGGIFRKLTYGLIGSGAMASICYPKEAEQVAQQALVEAKKGANG